jgi:hypothetical protein
MWQTSGKRRRGLRRAEGCRLDLAMKLHGYKREILSEGVALRDEFRHLLDRATPSSLVSLRDDDGKVLGTKE